MSQETSLDHDIEIRQVNTWDVSEITDLYRAGGWWQEAWDETGIPPLIKGSCVFFVAVDRKTSRAIGMGRLVSDGVSDGYIQDIVVLSPYRKTGVGGRIVSELLSEGKKCGLSWIGLIALPGSEQFYTELGFQRMEGHTPMLYKGGK